MSPERKEFQIPTIMRGPSFTIVFRHSDFELWPKLALRVEVENEEPEEVETDDDGESSISMNGSKIKLLLLGESNPPVSSSSDGSSAATNE